MITMITTRPESRLKKSKIMIGDFDENKQEHLGLRVSGNLQVEE